MKIAATVIAVGIVLSSSVHAQVLLDGRIDLSEWSVVDTTSQPNLQPWGPARVEIDDETLIIQTTGEIPQNTSPNVFDTGVVVSALNQSATDDRFANGFFRATVRAGANTESIPSLFLRGDTSTFSGYQFRGNGSLGEFQIESFIDGGAVNLLGQMNRPEDPKFSVGEDWIIEAGAVHDRLSMKVWRAGEPEPAEPQLVVFDDLLSGGQIALAASVSPTELGQPTKIDVTFDDVLFRAVPEPTTIGLALLGFPVAVLPLRRRRHT